jgi:hypothetical protein
VADRKAHAVHLGQHAMTRSITPFDEEIRLLDIAKAALEHLVSPEK